MLPPAKHPHPKWLADAIFYEIYPQSFVDSNGDGIGDIPGITLKLDYIKDLGCNAIWLNPCFDSPFKDAGYDVRDYKKVASRYGTNDDLIALFDAAHRRDMHVILDLVPGHTSEEHEWFHRSCKVERNNYSDRYIWTDSWISGGDGLPFIGGESPRNGTYILNFFKCQPALNYGFAHPERSWQKPALGPDAKATCDAMVDVMRFWLSRGADGFRVDMADSLVKKDDEGKPYTIRTWQYMFARIRPAFPEAAFVSEWGRPEESMAAGFDMDFYLDWRWDGVPNGYNMLLRNVDDPLSRKGDKSYFNADSGTRTSRVCAKRKRPTEILISSPATTTPHAWRRDCRSAKSPWHTARCSRCRACRSCITATKSACDTAHCPAKKAATCAPVRAHRCSGVRTTHPEHFTCPILQNRTLGLAM